MKRILQNLKSKDFLEHDLEELSCTDFVAKGLLLFWKSTPNFVTQMAVAVVNISQMLLCKLSSPSDEEIAGLGLGVTWLNACSYAMVSTINSGMLSLLSHSFGAQNYRLLG